MGDNNRTANATRWTRGEVFELLALIVGLPAAIAAVMVISTVWKRHRRRRRVHSADDSEPGTTEAQSRSTSISIPIAEGSTERNRMHRGRHFELQELETDKNIGCGGEMDLLDPSSVGVRTLEGERRCRLHTRQNLSSAVDDKSSTSMIRKDKMQSQKEMDEIGTGDLTAWFREEFEKANAQMTMEKDEWAISRVNGTA